MAKNRLCLHEQEVIDLDYYDFGASKVRLDLCLSGYVSRRWERSLERVLCLDGILTVPYVSMGCMMC